MSPTDACQIRLIHSVDDANDLSTFLFGRLGAGTRVPLNPLAGPRTETWRGASTATSIELPGAASARADGQWMIAHLWQVCDSDAELESAAESVYRRISEICAQTGYRNVLRCWNFFDRINQGEGDDERYRRFCVGRYRAIAVPGFEARLPAATVIGTHEPGLFVSVLAGREPGIALENPRQTRAYEYPRDYGPVSPSFARATLVGDRLLVSGTASVVGHATRHPDDTAAQFSELTHNLRTLLAHASESQFPSTPKTHWRPEGVRVYLRNPEELARILPMIAHHFGVDTPCTVLHGDICRADLRVEVEGVWRLAESD